MKISGKHISLRTVKIDDAKFTYEMRQDSSKTKYLSKVSGTIENQEAWIKSYQLRESNNEEYYFIIESKENESLGLVRMYDFKDNSFSWGSWLIKDNAPRTTAIESVLQIYEFGFYNLGFEESHFEVRKGNNKVISFHQRFGAQIIDEDELNYYFIIKNDEYKASRIKYKRYL